MRLRTNKLTSTVGTLPTPIRPKKTGFNLKRTWPIYMMILPGFLFFIIFKYIPMVGIVIAFQNYDPIQGFLGSSWAGFENFERLFTTRNFWPLMANTIILSALDIVFFFPMPIILAILLNEVRRKWFKAVTQTIFFAPHFLSWVVIVAITVVLFAARDGGVNILLRDLGFNTIEPLTTPAGFRITWILHNIWQGTGWGAIIFLAAISGVNPNLYEVASIDGAGRLRQMWHITLPAIRGVIIVLFILRLGAFMDIGFEHVLLLQNPLNMQTSDIFDTYIYRTGILMGNFSYTTAVGIFKGVIGLILVVGANKVVKKLGEEGIF
ncbi:ABC transporter permease [Lederbergia citri]|uniref:Sugar ABC transporter permease n=1 Tax=Lederbergia citri TaxID=2833580 RepID=A0A942YIS8_9BACI|nr:ABC transporter permease subunit [Lederbergia citri]MBS4195666.1 sugar ABC transporter permease [Lederbergia citri]